MAPGAVGADVAHAAALLRGGGVVAFPTETVYGLGADASNPEALARVYAIKGRPRSHPLIVHLADASELGAWSEDVPEVGRALAARFWPGPLTLIVRRSARVSALATAGQDTVGLRVPSHPMARALLRAFGGGIAAPSANRFGRISPTCAMHVQQDLGADVDYVLDGGSCEVGVESTIIDLSRGVPVLLRSGGLARAALEEVLGAALLGADEARADARSAAGALPHPRGPAPAAPGTLVSHYAPRARLLAVAPAQVPAAVAAQGAARVAVLAPAQEFAAWPKLAATTRALPDDLPGMARDLYAAMRDLDAGDFDVIVAALPAEVGLGEAVADRLRRAAGPKDDADGGMAGSLRKR
ncbi:MAG: threonylcarbamoyl-AMP synthase [Myxococcales bacterium]|nr:threonylcarbamoyl-AMP synthase [Myxococcales bacterium]